MQIEKVEVVQAELNLRRPVQMALTQVIKRVTTIFVHIETRQGQSAWGCGIGDPDLTGEQPATVLQACQAGAELVPDLHPTNIEYSLAKLAPVVGHSPAASCAFDLAFHDLLGLASGMPLYRLLGGYRNRIQTSVTIPIAPVKESVSLAEMQASRGFRMLKVKGGLDPEEDVRRVRAINRALPEHTLRLDPDGAYSVQDALDVARALEGKLEMLEQPTPSDDLDGLRQVTSFSRVPILADQSVTGPSSALALADGRTADGLSVKMATCGGFRCARQMDAIAQAARIVTMVSCVPESALLIAAGLSFALSSPNVRYGDLDGHLDLIDDPCEPSFRLEDGWLIASEVAGLGCRVNLV